MKDNQKELFLVVNKQDKIIGYRTRYDCHHDKNLIHRAIGVVIFNSKGQILLQKRSKLKDLNPGLYTLSASGHVTKGQTYYQAAQRELDEELGIKIPLKREKRYLAKSHQETEMDCLFTGQYDGPFYPAKDEVEKVEFVDINNLPKMISELTPFAILSLKELNLLPK